METKWCPHCRADLPVDRFYRNKRTKSGLTVHCKEYSAEYHRDNRGKRLLAASRANARSRYGLELEEYWRLLALGCSVCGSMRRMVMDHNHATNSVRGPLCNNCNVALGQSGDSPDLLRKLADYLEKHSGTR